ncbi:MAG TPA: DUF2207 domain-containing protein [Tetrasphaera sp.]|uniref:DUF2207 family protein n=1 Tax=Nostocoides sp. TaxID=1917966 RepID=UPI002C11CFA7|nr:hypothetical protein [Tetrasphaera sp.]HNQ06833.1 DUF2207 domain-containing protein [Tetrasphaera sp.]
MAGMLDGGRLASVMRASDSWSQVAHSDDVVDFLPMALALSIGILIAAIAIAIPVALHARVAGRDDQAADTPPNLLPLLDGPTNRVDDRLRNAVVQFDLPADLTPEQMAVLRFDGQPERAIAAALLDLEARGVIAIERPKVRVTVEAGADRSGISEFQRRLITVLGHDELTKPLENRDWALSTLYADAMGRGWFRHRPDYASYGPRLWSAACLGFGFILGVYTANMFLEGYWTFAMPLAAGMGFLLFLAWVFTYAERRRPIRTPKARALATQLAGFGRVLGATEQGWLRVHPDEPYPPTWAAVAMSLGVSSEAPGPYARAIRR